MDQLGSLVDTSLKIYPSQKFIAFIETIPISENIPINILRYIKEADAPKKKEIKKLNVSPVYYTNADIESLNKIKKIVDDTDNPVIKNNDTTDNIVSAQYSFLQVEDKDDSEKGCEVINKEAKEDNYSETENDKMYLTTSDIDWVYAHINARREEGENVPFLHEVFQGTHIAMPENRVIKRNPVLEARCVKLRAQQEAREYRKMTKGVDNVRMRYPEDSISYQLKQLNRQLIAIGQFVISIFAGFLFGFRGVEWMVGNLDFGVRLLLGVMCALIIALAEIYFLAKKLNEELTMTETIQLGGPPKFSNQSDNRICNSTPDNKEHQD